MGDRLRGARHAAYAAGQAAAVGEEVLFWASPAGRPLYEAMGFVIADEVDAWAIGASAEDLAAVPPLNSQEGQLGRSPLTFAPLLSQ